LLKLAGSVRESRHENDITAFWPVLWATQGSTLLRLAGGVHIIESDMRISLLSGLFYGPGVHVASTSWECTRESLT
jgi:hypothetical protein